MKTIKLLVAGFFTTIVLVGQAQIVQPGWYSSGSLVQPQRSGAFGAAQPKKTALLSGQGFSPLLIQGPNAIAEAVTPEIQALANGLENNPVRIFDYVHDHIRHVLYFGSKKGSPIDPDGTERQ